VTDHAIVLTAFDRPDYLRQTLDSWAKVDGLKEWPFIFRLEPSHWTGNLEMIIRDFIDATGISDNAEIVVNEFRLGVLHHPWVAMEELFNDFDFVVRAEDDLVVSTDVLRYFEWAAETFRDDRSVAVVNAFTREPGTDPAATRFGQIFNPWIWGTWRYNWRRTISPTWDHAYTTGTGNDRGWDANLGLRVLPQNRLETLSPECSRVKNIGVRGVHGTAENLPESPSFVQVREPVEFSVPPGYTWSED
jgi:hypothetical protein